MNKLIDDVLHHICTYLTFDDQIALKQTCKTLWQSIKIRKDAVKRALHARHKDWTNLEEHRLFLQGSCQKKQQPIFNKLITCETRINHNKLHIYARLYAKITFIEPTMWVCIMQNAIFFDRHTTAFNAITNIFIVSHHILNNGYNLFELKHHVNPTEREYGFFCVLFHQDKESGYFVMTNSQYKNLKYFVGIKTDYLHCPNIYDVFRTYSIKTNELNRTILSTRPCDDGYTWCIVLFNPKMNVNANLIKMLCQKFAFNNGKTTLVAMFISGRMYYIKCTSLKNILITLIYLFELHTQYFNAELCNKIHQGICDSREACKQLHKIALPIVKKQNINTMVEYIQSRAINDAQRLNILNAIMELNI
jgi:hypothetical protein